MTPHLFFGLCRALWLVPPLLLTAILVPPVLVTTYLASRAGLLPPAPREPEKRPEEPKLRVVGGREIEP